MASNFVDTTNFFWKIENFHSVSKEVSPVLFSSGLKWQLKFVRFVDEGIEKFSLYLECLNPFEMPSPWMFNASVGFTHNDGRFSLMKNINCNLKDREWRVWADDIRNISSEYGPITDITLFIGITPKLKNLFKKQQNVSEMYQESVCLQSLTGNFGKLYNNEKLSDFTIKCGGKCFYVQETVLSVRSDFFAGMFRSNMKEVKERCVNIEDFESEILEVVLRYMYTTEIPQVSMESIRKVYEAADRFGVESLKLRCYSLLMNNFVSDSEKNLDEEVEEEVESTDDEVEEVDNIQEQAEVEPSEPNIDIEKELLRRLFMTGAWRSFSEAFPHKAQEMCVSYLLNK